MLALLLYIVAAVVVAWAAVHFIGGFLGFVLAALAVIVALVILVRAADGAGRIP